MIYYITKTEHLFILKHSIKNCTLNLPHQYIIGLTQRSHVAPKMQHVPFCDTISFESIGVVRNASTRCAR